MEDPDQPVGLFERQRTQQDGVHDAEDRRVGADAEREDRDDGERERGRARQHPEGVSEIGGERSDHGVSLRR